MTGQSGGNDSLAALRRITVFVLLSLLVVVTVGNFVDDIFFQNQFNTDPALFALVGGMITGLFSAEAIAMWRSGRGGGGDEHGAN